MIRLLLRSIAILIAVLGAIDPALTAQLRDTESASSRIADMCK